MSDHLLSQNEIDALVQAEKNNEKKPDRSQTKSGLKEVQKLFTALEPKLGEALALLTGTSAATTCLRHYTKAGTDAEDTRYVISLGSTENHIDILVYVDVEATSSILSKISEQPDQTDEFFTPNNMEVFGRVIEALENEFSKQVSLLSNRHFVLSLALPKGLSSLQEFLDPLKDYVVLEYKLEWNEVEVGVIGFILDNDDIPSIFPSDIEDDTTSSLDALINDSINDSDVDIFSHFTDDFDDVDEPTEDVVVNPVQFGTLKGETKATAQSDSNLDIILDLPVTVTVELGRTNKTLEDILNLKPGSVVELDRLAGEPVDVLANGVFVAKGEVVVIDETFGVKITEIASKKQRLSRIK